MRRFALLSVPVLLVACAKPAEEAPDDLDALAAFMFANFDTEGDELASGSVNIEEYLNTLELDGDVEDRTVGLTALTSENFGGITVNSDYDGTEQVPRAVSGISSHDLAANAGLALETNHICIESDTTKYAGRSFLSGDDCWPDNCDRLETFNEIRKENTLAQVWFDVYKDFRMITLEDGRDVMVARSWMEDQFMADGGNNSWDELYGFEAWIPTEDGTETQRFYAFWSSVTLSAIGDDIYGNLVRAGIDEGYVYGDAFLSGTTTDVCNNDRDRAYDRE
ncbi:MAG: hypothetical protein KC912_03465 [Proteobacteria bacterium]|nr:hypothetical protein [Pseudomonadota bacterium]